MIDAMVHKCADFQACFHPIDTILVIHTTHLQEWEAIHLKWEVRIVVAMRG